MYMQELLFGSSKSWA